jgi:hypothetical protein
MTHAESLELYRLFCRANAAAEERGSSLVNLRENDLRYRQEMGNLRHFVKIHYRRTTLALERQGNEDHPLIVDITLFTEEYKRDFPTLYRNAVAKKKKELAA